MCIRWTTGSTLQVNLSLHQKYFCVPFIYWEVNPIPLLSFYVQIVKDTKSGSGIAAAIAPWFRLRLPSCGPGFNLYYWNCNGKRTKINKERLGLAHFLKRGSETDRTKILRVGGSIWWTTSLADRTSGRPLRRCTCSRPPRSMSPLRTSLA